MIGLQTFLLLVGVGAGFTVCVVLGYIWEDIARAASRYLKSKCE